MALEHGTKPTDLGMNRTGIGTSPVRAKEMQEGAGGSVPPGGDGGSLAVMRAEMSREAPPVGTVPVPSGAKGVAKTALAALQGRKASVFVDKLGERLAFERAGVRLYDAVLAKMSASKTEQGSLAAEDLRRLRDEELRHMQLVREALEVLGADPTAVTPCADLAGVKGAGLAQVVTDPRTTMAQCLDALLVAELADNDGWKLLIAMAEALGQDELARRFTDALAEEDQHLGLVRRWVAERVELELGAKLPPLQFGEPLAPPA